MTIEHMILGVALATAVAVATLLVLAIRQARHCRFIGSQVAETQDTCQRLGTRIDDVTARCETEFTGVRGRLALLETSR